MLDSPGHQREHGVEGTRGAIAFPHEGRPVAEEAWDGRGGCRFDGRRREPALDISYELYILTLTVVSIVFAVLSYLYAPIDDRMSRIFSLGSKQMRRQVIAQRAQFTLLFAASRRSC